MDWELRHWFFQRSSAPGPCSAGNMDPAVAQITACKLLLPSVQTTFPGVVKPSPARGPPRGHGDLPGHGNHSTASAGPCPGHKDQVQAVPSPLLSA